MVNGKQKTVSVSSVRNIIQSAQQCYRIQILGEQ
ncbi:hypothetical protein VCE_003022 [Vibrio cholerae B33]|nr:hypothetical protein VCE_003022 [Vibrio cholerae B33]EEO20574.1 hypothetical protein VCF_003382 [Vibrio cholerae BX 330286]